MCGHPQIPDSPVCGSACRIFLSAGASVLHTLEPILPKLNPGNGLLTPKVASNGPPSLDMLVNACRDLNIEAS